MVKQDSYEKDLFFEKQRLDKVNRVVAEQLEIATQNTQSLRDRLIDIKRSLWEDYNIGSMSGFNQQLDVVQQMDELNRQGQAFGVHQNTYRKLKLIENSPYFGRLDFFDAEMDETLNVYIGLVSLVDPKTKEHLVFDWRAPISSLFYDYGLGEAVYHSPGGDVRGEITLKRQFKIEDKELKYMFDNSLKIDDDVLQEMLGKRADDKMRHIVNTIQREQNQAIRDEGHDLLLVTGPAGSGKTSIALHRAAYLLYRHRDNIKSTDIVIFSPNKVFNDYISNVLPELGESNILQTTFSEYVDHTLNIDIPVESFANHMEYILSRADVAERIDTIRFKISSQFLNAINKLADYVETEMIKFQDVSFRGTTLFTADELKNLFTQTYAYLPPVARIQKMLRRIKYVLDPLRKAEITKIIRRYEQENANPEMAWQIRRKAIIQIREEYKQVFEQINKWLKIDVFAIYFNLFHDEILFNRIFGEQTNKLQSIKEASQKTLKLGLIGYEDVAPILLLKGLLEGFPVVESIRHVIVDEAQDYSTFHFEIIKRLFPKATFTILGDPNQLIHPFVEGELEKVEDHFLTNKRKTIRLSKSYRSTKQILLFCNRILGNEMLVEPIDRSGPEPTISKVKDEGELVRKLGDRLMEIKNKDYESIAIVTKTAKEARTLHSSLKELNQAEIGRINLLENEEQPLLPGLTILPVYLAKGLEFDAVVIANVSSKVYKKKDSKLLYTACSRALHELHLFYIDEISPLLGS